MPGAGDASSRITAVLCREDIRPLTRRVTPEAGQNPKEATMGFLKGLFGGNKSEPGAAAIEDPANMPECGHVTVVPRWDNAEDMGKSDKVTVYHCEGCNTDFTPSELDEARVHHPLG